MDLALAQGGIELKQFRRTWQGLVFTMILPILLLVIFASIFRSIDLRGGVTLSQYFIAGMIAVGIMTPSFQNLAITIPIERDRGVLKRYRGTPMPKWVYFAGKIMAVAVLCGLSIILLLIVAVSFYDMHLPKTAEKWVTCGWVSLLGMAACTLLGIAFSSVPRKGTAAPGIVTPIALVLQFTSGVFFP